MMLLLIQIAFGQQDVAELLPLGGAGAMFIILLRLLQVERSRWVSERATLIAEHREERDSMRAEHAAALAAKDRELERKDHDRERAVTFLRERVRNLEAENRDLRGVDRDRNPPPRT